VRKRENEREKILAAEGEARKERRAREAKDRIKKDAQQD